MAQVKDNAAEATKGRARQGSDVGSGTDFDYQVSVKVPVRKSTDIHKPTVRMASEAVEKASSSGVHVVEVGPSSLGIGTAFTDKARMEILDSLDSSLKAVGLTFAQDQVQAPQ